ncbi:MAG: tungstate transport system substrate-binding protein [Elusimicrobia bacterium]|nr:MAG: tungstate transport system substrate-binding protein [Elusimicrobiota bacterium]KAF0157891.1 MAG: tungstate transport system substrate-binding protein [Elusimicrobiota bacterium]
MTKIKISTISLCFALAAGCAGDPAQRGVVRLATTTSVRDSGLLDALTEEFHKDGKWTLQAIAVGSGQAMQLGRTGEADLLWVHSPDAEADFVAQGFGTDRVTFLHNDFVLLGPAADPAGVGGVKTAAEAFRKIAASGATFISRADKSGTHVKEMKVWEAAGVKPAWPGYLEAGQGMAGTLSIAGEKRAYVLADRSTWLSMRGNLSLAVVHEGDPALLNRYSLILVNPERFPKANAAGARAFYSFVLSERSRAITEKFGADKYGEPLFHWDLPAK